MWQPISIDRSAAQFERHQGVLVTCPKLWTNVICKWSPPIKWKQQCWIHRCRNLRAGGRRGRFHPKTSWKDLGPTVEFDLTQLDSSDDECNLAGAGHNVMPRLGDNSSTFFHNFGQEEFTPVSEGRRVHSISTIGQSNRYAPLMDEGRLVAERPCQTTPKKIGKAVRSQGMRRKRM